MEKILNSKVKIRFQDCDPFNHLNNSRYIDYFLNAREDQLKEHYGLDIAELMNVQQIGWLVSSNQISYIAPVATMETVIIRSQLIRCTDRALLVEMTMWSEDAKQLKAIIWIKFIPVDLSTKVVMKHSSEMMMLFEAIVEPCEQTVFEERQISIFRNYIAAQRSAVKLVNAQ